MSNENNTTSTNTSSKKKKTAAAITAAVLAALIAVTGTFAWQSISQQATNEASGIANPGGRLHDDFTGYGATDTKDIYVENFTDSGDSGVSIFARVKLTEYMETGGGAGTGSNADSLVTGKTLANKADWTVHKYDPDTKDTSNTSDPFHEYWEWSYGGSTVYMPTFNKNKDSLAADINGTYAGMDATNDTHYDDYVQYVKPADTVTTADADLTSGVTAADITNFSQEIRKKKASGTVGIVTAPAFYDVSSETNDADESTDKANPNPGNGGTENTNWEAKTETHRADNTLGATVVTMDKWIADGMPLGNYWVYDTDGWAYWANYIEPGTATGCLLTGIAQTGKQPQDKWYYAINAEAQFCTADDLFTTSTSGGITDSGKALLEKAKKSLYNEVTEEGPLSNELSTAIRTAAGTDSTVEIDGDNFQVVAIDDTANVAVLIVEDFVQQPFDKNDSVDWSIATSRSYLNNVWLTNHPTLEASAVANSFYSHNMINSNSYVKTTGDKVFILTEADVYGTTHTISGTTTAEAKDYTFPDTTQVTDSDIVQYSFSGKPLTYIQSMSAEVADTTATGDDGYTVATKAVTDSIRAANDKTTKTSYKWWRLRTPSDSVVTNNAGTVHQGKYRLVDVRSNATGAINTTAGNGPSYSSSNGGIRPALLVNLTAKDTATP